jgi:hypothetical protein
MMIRQTMLCLLITIMFGATAAIAADIEASGIIKTSQGTVVVDRGGKQTPAAAGTAVFVGDRVHTGPGSYVGITLRDDTLLTGGPESTLLITEFQFNPATHDGNMLISLLKGTFSVVTGLIGKQSPKSVGFKTPSMTLGIRGTEFIVEVGGAAE